MLTVHHLNQSRSQRVLWLLEELGLEYQIKHYQRNKLTMLAPPELKAVHPLGKSPVISDGDLVIAETGAIIEYLIEKYGKGALIPAAGSAERLRYTYWLHYAEGSLMPLLVMKLVISKITPGAPALIRPIARPIVNSLNQRFLGPNLKTHLDFVESELARSEWLAGDALSAADVIMSFPLEAASARNDDGVARPHIQAFVERVRARPAYQRALEKGGPYELLK